jgi:hypothetical protein
MAGPTGIDIRDKKLGVQWQNKDISRGFGVNILGGKLRLDLLILGLHNFSFEN